MGWLDRMIGTDAGDDLAVILFHFMNRINFRYSDYNESLLMANGRIDEAFKEEFEAVSRNLTEFDNFVRQSIEDVLLEFILADKVHKYIPPTIELSNKMKEELAANYLFPYIITNLTSLHYWAHTQKQFSSKQFAWCYAMIETLFNIKRKG